MEEIYIHIFIVVACMIYMLYSMYLLSDPQLPNYSIYKKLLRKGWLFGPDRLIDNSDIQYAGFRNNIPILLVVLLAETLVSRIVSRFFGGQARLYFSLTFSILFILVLHGFGAVKLIFLVVLGYYIARSTHGKLIIWIFGVSMLFANDYFQGNAFFQLP